MDKINKVTLTETPIKMGVSSVLMRWELPSDRQTEIAIAVTIPVVVDVQTLVVKVTDVDVIAVRVEVLLTSACVIKTRSLLLLPVYILSSLNLI